MSGADQTLQDLLAEVRGCRICAAHLPHGPQPVVRIARSARLLIIGQAPGTKVHASGVPWDDPSGDRLRDWTGLPKDVFYNEAQVAIMPMGFCFPGTGTSGDLPPRPECAPTWHAKLLAHLPDVRLTLLVGSYAVARYGGAGKTSLSDRVLAGPSRTDGYLPLPHPSWRSQTWTKARPWFETDVLPVLRRAVSEALAN